MNELEPQKPVIGITLGDYNGIGPEIILKTLQNNQLNRVCTPVVYGSMRIMNRYRQLFDMKDWNLFGIQKIEQANAKSTNILNCWNEPQEDIQPGQATPESGKGAFLALTRAVEDLKAGKLSALVTAPINKYNIQNDDFKFAGHTEYLAEAFEAKEPLMFMVSDLLRVGVVTGHVPLSEVSAHITKTKIVAKLQAMLQSLRRDFNVQKPRIAVLGLNPHAGEEGLLGKEEQEIIAPALKELKNKGHLIFGPFPADGFFAAQSYRQYDAVLAMYHDQGLIPFKSIAFSDGVNFTAGLSVVRTSPDHGTAYDIAGKNQADETSLRRAIFTAIDIFKSRQEADDLAKNALKKSSIVEKMNVSEHN